MRASLAMLLSLLSVTTAFARSDAAADTLAPVTIAERYSIQSKVLREPRTILVHKPGGYDFTHERYPVVVLLDGESMMHHVSATTDFLANNGRTMPVIVVGIENTDRQRDFTPPWTSATEGIPKGSIGGAREFLSFITDELLPHIDSHFRTRPTRILIGHSYGGLFSVYALLNRPDVFKAHIAISPSLWWDDQALVKQADAFADSQKDVRIAMYMTMGNEVGPMLGGAQKVVGALASPQLGIEAMFHQWPGESHGSVVMRSVYEGMEWLYEPYYTHDPIRTYELSGLQSFDKRFALISGYVGYQVRIPEHQLMQVYEYLVEMKRLPEARVVVEHVANLYPKNGRIRAELGRTLMELNEKQAAIDELTQALQLHPGHSGARTALRTLGVDPETIVREHAVTVAKLRTYVGTYRYADETTTVALAGDKLMLTVGRETRELRASSETTFHAVDHDTEYTFGRGSMTVHLPEFEYEAKRVRESK